MATFQTFKQFLLYMENNYDEEEQITIENFMSYYINKYTGFGRHNCEYTYQEDLKNDTSGKLHAFALIGFEFEKKIYDERQYKKSIKKSKKKL
jgi:hypothetical protein